MGSNFEDDRKKAEEQYKKLVENIKANVRKTVEKARHDEVAKLICKRFEKAVKEATIRGEKTVEFGYTLIELFRWAISSRHIFSFFKIIGYKGAYVQVQLLPWLPRSWKPKVYAKYSWAFEFFAELLTEALTPHLDAVLPSNAYYGFSVLCEDVPPGMQYSKEDLPPGLGLQPLPSDYEILGRNIVITINYTW